MRTPATLMLMLFVSGVACAAPTVWTVQSTARGGAGSLKWAINQANASAGRDRIEFDAGLIGKTILPIDPLPYLTDDYITIDGDINDDGQPDIGLGGAKQLSGNGLVVTGNNCTIVGLFITNFHDRGIALSSVSGCKIRACHVGVNRRGTTAVPNTNGQILIVGGESNRIGGNTTATRNIFGVWYEKDGPKAEPSEPPEPAIEVLNSSSNTIVGNCVGIGRDGRTLLGNKGIGILLRHSDTGFGLPADLARGGPPIAPCDYNTVGGTTAVGRNVIGGCTQGVSIQQAHHNVVQGNYFGLKANGRRAAYIGGAGVEVSQGSTDNTIGGKDEGARNVFGRSDYGVVFDGLGTSGNRVQGNYIGTSANGRLQFQLSRGVVMMSSAGPQLIGGGTARAGNICAPITMDACVNVDSSSLADGTVIRNNTFGVLPSGTNASNCSGGVDGFRRVEISDNLFANHSQEGIRLYDTPFGTKVLRNIFRNCGVGVQIQNVGRCVLGNLNNTSTYDDGGNIFRRNNTMNIRNDTPYVVKAQGNSFGTTDRAEINSKIWDRRDDGTLGPVRFSPLSGGVLPTGGTVAVTGIAAVPTAAGAEIAFSLSAPAEVTVSVLNIAGRPVATAARSQEMGAGAQRVVWSGRTLSGTRAPAGRYLVRIEARGEEGQAVQALASLALTR
jgi:hypothetical protein